MLIILPFGQPVNQCLGKDLVDKRVILNELPTKRECVVWVKNWLNLKSLLVGSRSVGLNKQSKEYIIDDLPQPFIPKIPVTLLCSMSSVKDAKFFKA